MIASRIASRRCCQCRPSESPSESPAGITCIRPRRSSDFTSCLLGVTCIQRTRLALPSTTITEVAYPRRQVYSQRRPFVGCALRVTVHLHDSPIYFDQAVAKLRFAKAGAGVNLINDLSVALQNGFYCIEISIAPAPEIQIIHPFRSLNNFCLPGRDRYRPVLI